MSNQKRKAAIPDRLFIPLWSKDTASFEVAVRKWFRERHDFLKATKVARQYFNDFAIAEERFFSRFADELKHTGKTAAQEEATKGYWQMSLCHIRDNIYIKALDFLGRIGYWKKENNFRPHLKFNKTHKSVTFLDPVNGYEKEKMLNSNTVSAFLCLKVLTDCRLKRSRITCKELYEYLRHNCPKCMEWELFKDDLVHGWKLIFDNVQTVNRWFPQPILGCGVEYVRRLL